MAEQVKSDTISEESKGKKTNKKKTANAYDEYVNTIQDMPERENEFKTLADYKRFASTTYLELNKGSTPKNNVFFLKEILKELLVESHSGEVQDYINFLDQILVSRKKEEKDSRKKTKQSLNTGSGKTVAPPATTTQAEAGDEEEYYDEEDEYFEEDEYAAYYDDY